jgi:hypothetical protein
MVGTSSFLISSRVPLKPRARSILTEGSNGFAYGSAVMGVAQAFFETRAPRARSMAKKASTWQTPLTPPPK